MAESARTACAFTPARDERATVGPGEVYVSLLLADRPAPYQFLRALVLLLGIGEFGLFGGDLGERSIAVVLGLPDLGLRLAQLRIKRLRVKGRDDLPGLDRVAFVEKDFLDAPGDFCRDVNFLGLKPAVAARETRWQSGLAEYVPGDPPPTTIAPRHT